jgi:Fe-S-cluster containining protein
MTDIVTPQISDSCRRCGTCCRKGGPALHKIDRDLVVKGIIPLKDLFTIRAGEFVSNQIKKTDEPSPEDIIKIKGSRHDSWCCCYFSPAQNSCRIYTNRPSECRILKCWDTREIEAAYQVDRLSRENLLGSVAGLIELIEFHQAHCDHRHLNNWIEDLSHKNEEIQKKAEKRILESIHWDQHLRALTPQKTNTDHRQLDFLFGRPLHYILKIHGWRIHQKGNNEYCLRAITQ